MLLKKIKNLSGMQLIAFGFFLLILCGALLLMLPISSRNGSATPFMTALFTATSATCVTGLILADTYTQWSTFGQIVILSLIQIGGLGFITIGTAVSMILRRKIGLKQRGWIKESFNVLDIGGVVRLIRLVLKGTLLFEGIGAIVLAIRFFPQMGLAQSIYYGIFHSISAFCNAGFDLMGRYEQFSSFTAYYDDPVVCFTICALILIGGIGFIVWSDIAEHKWHFRKYALQTKMVLSASFVLVFGGALLFYFIEGNRLYADMSTTGKICSAFFSAITPRTAGFNTTDTGALSEGGKLLTIILMFIGGGSGSTAGGVKMATIFVLLLHLRSTLTRSMGTNIYGRRIDDATVTKAAALLCTYLFCSLAATLAICSMQNFAIGDTLFEVVSAICTVGMSTGITGELNLASQMIIAFLMYIGRLGSLSFALSFTDHKKTAHIMQPIEHINIG
ncbi:MAG: TrkH family potassium uptake protein [Clostridiales bacterium]|nr:TrkH family potassium uptake protein [Roseburia sp.]MDD7635761.1 TrkH family potassium uptake protein [Clostridiales bacterium]MDY4112288.1 TrkH family potassium uptake protein [Roseburia sp.]